MTTTAQDLNTRPEYRRYRLTIDHGFGMPPIFRHDIATSADDAARSYEQRMSLHGGKVVLVEDLGPIATA